jgi:VanZ family protein
VILIMGGIFLLSHQPGDSLPMPDITNFDKLSHCLVYAVLGVTFLFALPPSWRQRHPLLAGCATVLFCLGYGITDEFHQSFIPGRFASGGDLVADTVGGVLAIVGEQGRQRVTRPASFRFPG